MSTASAAIFGLLTTQADLSFYTQQLEIYSAKYQANAEKLSSQQSYEEKYEGFYDDVMTPTKAVKIGHKTIINEDLKWNGTYGSSQRNAAEKYAQTKAPKFNAELLEELTELDMEYETIKTTCEAMVEMLKAQKEAEKTNATTACQDTGLLGQ